MRPVPFFSFVWKNTRPASFPRRDYAVVEVGNNLEELMAHYGVSPDRVCTFAAN